MKNGHELLPQDTAVEDSVEARMFPGVSVDARYLAYIVNANAKYASGRIVRNLWVIFVLLPVVLAVLFAILK